MAWTFWAQDGYRVHVYCALCGGPFARVYRTDEGDAEKRLNLCGDVDPDQIVEDVYLDEREGLTQTISSDLNHVLSRGKLEALAHPLAAVEEELQKANRRKGHYQETREATVRAAYDGRKIAEEEMRWTRLVRALIHEDANYQPQGGLEQLNNHNPAYLTGRGRVREDGPLADAFPSMRSFLEDEHQGDEFDDSQVPVFVDSAHQFHLYQEIDRSDRRFVLGSIPFHEACWDIFMLAVQTCRSRRGLPTAVQPETVDVKLIWSYLRDMLPAGFREKPMDNPITRLIPSCLGGRGYREAQSSGSSTNWLHLDGMEWLAANPSLDCDEDHDCPSWRNLYPPTASAVQKAGSLQSVGTASYDDPFSRLPFDIFSEILEYLSCQEALNWRQASPAMRTLPIPPSVYWKFIYKQTEFVPQVALDVKESKEDPNLTRAFWRATFENIQHEFRRNSRLRNRQRIWKIVEPIADDIVERSRQNIERLSYLDADNVSEITVVRGSVGIRSGIEGQINSTLFTLTKGEDETELESEERALAVKQVAKVDNFIRTLQSIHVWLHGETCCIQGLEFLFLVPAIGARGSYVDHKLIGRQTAKRTSFGLDAEDYILTGFDVCWYGGCVQGIRFVFEHCERSASEFRDAEFLSPRFGSWQGPSRRLVAPREYRKLAGLIAFINAKGSFETFALLEEKIRLPSNDGNFTFIPPDTVPLNHANASLWIVPPPRNVELEDRVGPEIGDWQLRASSCEIFAQSAEHETHGGGWLERITGFAGHEFLCGIRFQYRSDNGRVHTRELGKCNVSLLETSFNLEQNDLVSAVIINFSQRGVHGLQMVTSSERVGKPMGHRYLGTRTVFIDLKAFPRRIKEGLGFITFLRSHVIGFHSLYSPELERFVQLGVVTIPDPPRIKPPYSLQTPPNSSPTLEDEYCPLKSWPFLEKDNFLNAWVDGTPPPSWTSVRKSSDHTKSPSFPWKVGFTGWAPLNEDLAQVTIYGRMEGIRFSYWSNEQDDLFFGDISARPEKVALHFESSDLITGLASDNTAQRFGHDQHEAYLPDIMFFASNRREVDEEVEVQSPYLVGIQFVFSASKIENWSPLLDFHQGADDKVAQERRLEHTMHSFISAESRKQHPTAQLDIDDSDIEHNCILHSFFAQAGGNQSIDAIKGYVIRGNISGFRFRRCGTWDAVPLGRHSAFERTFELLDDERVTSLYTSASISDGTSAVKFYTNLHRASPWFGEPVGSQMIYHHPQAGFETVGIFMVFSMPEECQKIGLVIEKNPGASSSASKPQDISRPNYPRGRQMVELPWVVNKPDLPRNYRLQPEIDLRHWNDHDLQRSWTVFDPENLEKIEAFVNDTPGRFGLKGLRITGNERMGVILLNDWREEFLTALDRLNIRINGAGGERIVGVDLSFLSFPHIPRIIRFVVKTNRGAEQDLADWSIFTKEEPDDALLSHKNLRVKRGEEVVGFHYVFGPLYKYVHDIALMTRPARP